jgi:hypothetical protein
MSNDCKINLNCILCIKIDLVQKFHPAFMALIHVNEPKIEPHRISSECYPELTVGCLLLLTASIQDDQYNPFVKACTAITIFSVPKRNVKEI